MQLVHEVRVAAQARGDVAPLRAPGAVELAGRADVLWFAADFGAVYLAGLSAACFPTSTFKGSGENWGGEATKKPRARGGEHTLGSLVLAGLPFPCTSSRGSVAPWGFMGLGLPEVLSILAASGTKLL